MQQIRNFSLIEYSLNARNDLLVTEQFEKNTKTQEGCSNQRRWRV